jgi:flagellar secretion chaperone FliS
MTNNRYLEQRVLSADPIELTHMVYQHAIDMVRDARRHLAAKDIAERSKSICKAIDAIAELESALDHSQGGQISQNLEKLYRYMQMRLTTANIQQQDGPLAEVENLLSTLGEAWSALRTTAPAPSVDVPPALLQGSGAWGGHMVPDSQIELAGHSWSV